MRILRLGAVVGIAAGLVGAWTAVGPGNGSASQQSGPTTYYIRPGGNDTAAGTSPATAWRTLARASQAQLLPGDRLMLCGGHSYSGTLKLDTYDGGSATKPVQISSYGTGRATIVSRTSGIVVYDTGGIAISRLAIAGNHAMNAADVGIQLFSDRKRGRVGHVRISKVDISGFGWGIAIGADYDGAGFRNVSITHSALHGNLDAGLLSYGPDFNPKAPGYAHENFYISHVRAFGNLGDPANLTRNTGSGIELGSVSHATVTHSAAYHNGGRGGATTEGPIGMWAYESTRVLFSHDVSHDNTSASVHDGGGFGLDLETSDSVMEYNLSYHNHGAGFLLYSALNVPTPQTGNTVRFNISYNDAIGAHHIYGAMTAGGRVNYGRFYQNTIVLTKGNTQPVVKLTGVLHHVQMYNNILVAANGPFVQVVPTLYKSLNHPMTTVNVFLAGNDYVTTGTKWFIGWNSKTFYFSLATWRRATGEEKIGKKLTGLSAAPRFVGPVSGAAGGAGFKLGPLSRLRNAGLNLRLLFNIQPGTVTFAGTRYVVVKPNIGAQ
jgi:hypothetical protein